MSFDSTPQPTAEEIEQLRSDEVDALLSKAGISRGEIEAEPEYVCMNGLCTDYNVPHPKAEFTLLYNEPFCPHCNDKVYAVGSNEAKPTGARITDRVTPPLYPETPITEPTETDRQKEATKAAEVNSETAAKAVSDELVPELGKVLAKYEPSALAYGFPPAVEALIERAKLDPAQTDGLLTNFRELFQQIGRWAEDVESIQITSINDTESIAKAKEVAKAIQKERLNAEKRKKIIKEPYLKPGQLIDGVFKVYLDEMTPIERMAIAKAQCVENLEKERKENIRLNRIEQLKPFVENIGAFNLHPDVMSDEAFAVTLDNCKQAHAARQKELAEAEEARSKIQRNKDRSYQLLKLGFSRDDESRRHLIGEITIYDNDLENESDTAWQTRIVEITPRVEALRTEQKRLADEAAAIKKAEAERLEAETNETLRKQREAEALSLAPDKVKLEKLASDIEAIVFPDVTNDKTISILGDTKSDLYQVVTRLRAKLSQLP